MRLCLVRTFLDQRRRTYFSGTHSISSCPRSRNYDNTICLETQTTSNCIQYLLSPSRVSNRAFCVFFPIPYPLFLDRILPNSFIFGYTLNEAIHLTSEFILNLTTFNSCIGIRKVSFKLLLCHLP